MVERYRELLDLIQRFERDYEKFYDKGNKTAGIRLRKHMQELRIYAKKVRDEIQEIKKELD